MARAFAAHARLLDPAERRGDRRDDAFVEAHHSVFERVAHPPCTPEIAGVAIGGEAVGRIVGRRDDLFLGIEGDDRRDGSEDLLTHDARIAGDVRHDGGFEEQAVPV